MFECEGAYKLTLGLRILKCDGAYPTKPGFGMLAQANRGCWNAKELTPRNHYTFNIFRG